MHLLKKLSFLAVVAFAACAISALQANERAAPVGAQDFVEEASAKGVAEIDAGKLALEKATSEDVKNFAQKMIDDHTKANEELAALAASKNLEISENAELMNQAKAWILQMRDGESFDKAYMNNQVVAHQQTIALFQRASQSEDAEIAAFAKEVLPKLEHHLQEAEKLNGQIPED